MAVDRKVNPEFQGNYNINGVWVDATSGKLFAAYPVYPEDPSYFVGTYGYGCPRKAPQDAEHAAEVGAEIIQVLKGRGNGNMHFHLVDGEARDERAKIVAIQGDHFSGLVDRSYFDPHRDGIRVLRQAVSDPIGQRLVSFLQGDRPSDMLAMVDAAMTPDRGILLEPIRAANARLARETVISRGTQQVSFVRNGSVSR